MNTIVYLSVGEAPWAHHKKFFTGGYESYCFQHEQWVLLNVDTWPLFFTLGKSTDNNLNTFIRNNDGIIAFVYRDDSFMVARKCQL